MSKIFILRDREIAMRMWDYIKATAQASANAGRPLTVEIGEYREKRSSAANARYWALLGEIAEQVQVGGKWFDRDVWHEWMKDRFAPKVEGPSGLLSVSTTQMNVEQFNQYMTQIESFAVQELGVEFAAI
jgi:hypothetical protein